jgi:hypothetical protein
MTAKRLPLIRMLVVALATAAPQGSPSLRGTPYPSPGPAPTLDAVDVGHQPFILAEHRDRFMFIYFGYTQFPNLVRIPGNQAVSLGVPTASFWGVRVPFPTPQAGHLDSLQACGGTANVAAG